MPLSLSHQGIIFLPDFQHAETMTLEVEVWQEPEVIRCREVDINLASDEIQEASRCIGWASGGDRYTPQGKPCPDPPINIRMSWGAVAGEM